MIAKLTFKDNVISALDDYAEYVVGSDFSGKISQSEAIEFILGSLADRIIKEEVRLYKAFEDNLEIQKGIKFMADRMMNQASQERKED